MMMLRRGGLSGMPVPVALGESENRHVAVLFRDGGSWRPAAPLGAAYGLSFKGNSANQPVEWRRDEPYCAQQQFAEMRPRMSIADSGSDRFEGVGPGWSRPLMPLPSSVTN